jgi:hypothetical protein
MSFRWRRAAAQDGPEDLMDTVIRWEDCITVTADTTIHIITDTTIPPISRPVTFSGCGTIRDPSETERGLAAVDQTTEAQRMAREWKPK